MAYSSTLSTRMWNCSTVSCSPVLLGNFLDIGCDGKSQYDSKVSSDLVPSAQNYMRIRRYASSEIFLATAVRGCRGCELIRWRVFLFRFLYFYPLKRIKI